MAQIKLFVKSLAGASIEDANVNIKFNSVSIDKQTDKNGELTVSGFTTGVCEIVVTADNYKDNSFAITIKEDSNNISKDVIMLSSKSVEDVTNKAAENIQKAIEPIVFDVIESFIFKQPTTVEEAKQEYKELEANVKAQRKVIEKALKDNLIDVLQSQATNYIYVAKSQLQPAMDYYVNARKQYSSNPFKSWVSFRNYMEYTAMIGGIVLLRQNMTKYMDKILEKLIANM